MVVVQSILFSGDEETILTYEQLDNREHRYVNDYNLRLQSNYVDNTENKQDSSK